MPGVFSILADEIALGGFIAAALYAALCDAARYIIPNRAPLAMLALFPLHAIIVPHAVVPDLVTGFCVLAAGAGLFALRLVGGGDVKFMAAVSLWAGPALFPALLTTVALGGGLLAGGALIRRGWRLVPAGWNHAFAAASHTKIPYGVAIAAGALLVAVRLDGL